jgi:hypothetical protein
MEEAMATAATTPLIGVQNVDVDHMNIAVRERAASSFNLAALTPLLSILIAALTLFSTSLIQIYQSRSSSAEKEDSDWRAALEKIEDRSAAIGTFEMQSFFEGERHKVQARSLSAALMPNITDKYEFDAAFFALLVRTNQDNQADVVGIARTLSIELHGLYDAAVVLKGCKGSPDCTFVEFVRHPEKFYDNASQSDALRNTLSDLWRLDSVGSGLRSMWVSKGDGAGVRPGDLDLGGIVFLNNDFSNIDFSKASMEEAEFIGKCPVNEGKTPPGIIPDCERN